MALIVKTDYMQARNTLRQAGYTPKMIDASTIAVDRPINITLVKSIKSLYNVTVRYEK